MLFFNLTCCAVSSALILHHSYPTLWLGALGIGFGVSSTYPALITLPEEMQIEMTPTMMASLQLFSSAGEMLGPFVIGILFQLQMYDWFARVCLLTQLISLAVLALTWGSLKGMRGRLVHPLQQMVRVSSHNSGFVCV